MGGAFFAIPIIGMCRRWVSQKRSTHPTNPSIGGHFEAFLPQTARQY
jgi:hypothetical protein